MHFSGKGDEILCHPFAQCIHTVYSIHPLFLSSFLGYQINCHSIAGLVFK